MNTTQLAAFASSYPASRGHSSRSFVLNSHAIRVVIDFSEALSKIEEFELYKHSKSGASNAYQILLFLVIEYFTPQDGLEDSLYRQEYGSKNIFADDILRDNSFADALEPIQEEIRLAVQSSFPHFDCMVDWHCTSVLDIEAHAFDKRALVFLMDKDAYAALGPSK